MGLSNQGLDGGFYGYIPANWRNGCLCLMINLGVSKNRGGKPRKMDGEYNGTPENPIKMDDLGVKNTIFGPPICRYKLGPGSSYNSIYS